MAFAMQNPEVIDLNAKDKYGNTAFHLACNFGEVSSVEKILKFAQAHPQKIDLTIRNALGKTGLERAEESDNLGSDNVVKLILQKRPDLNLM